MKVGSYTESELQHLLSEDDRVAEQGIRVTCREDGTVVLSGEVESARRRSMIEQVVAERLPGCTVVCDIGITRVHEPDDVEEL